MALSNTTTIQNILQEGGFDQKQAQTITEAIVEAYKGSDIVTNSSLNVRLKDLELRLVKWLITVVGVGVGILALLIEF